LKKRTKKLLRVWGFGCGSRDACQLHRGGPDHGAGHGWRQGSAGRSSAGTGYRYDSWSVARESWVCGTTTGKLLNVPGQDERYIRGEISGSTTTSVAYLTDALGSTVALAKNGAAQNFYGYDPFGVQATPTGVADGNP